MSGLLFSAVSLLISPRAVCKYFKRRYSVDQIAFLNETLAVRGQVKKMSGLLFLAVLLFGFS